MANNPPSVQSTGQQQSPAQSAGKRREELAEAAEGNIPDEAARGRPANGGDRANEGDGASGDGASGDGASGDGATNAEELGDVRLSVLLDEYLEALHQNDSGELHRLRLQCPELSDLAGCLDALESLAEASGDLPTPPTLDVTLDLPQLGLAKRFPNTLAPVQGDAGDPEEDSAISIGLPCQFGKYELRQLAGHGGMGVVYQAWEQDAERLVALKMIKTSVLASSEEVRRFRREAKAAARLTHPNIVRVLAVGQVHGQHYFTMDYIDGQTLLTRMRKTRMARDEAVELLIPVARAVDFLHTHGIIHRDLKPSNILLDSAGTPYVTDFGLAKVFGQADEETRSGTVVGTPSYMSPEQARGETTAISPSSDVYSLGAIFYELLTGRPPFQDDNYVSTLLQVLEGEPIAPRQINAAIPHDLEQICLRCLAKDPEGRYPSAAALAEDLERFLRGEPVEADTRRLAERVSRWARRRPALLAHLAALGFSLTVTQTTYVLIGTDQAYNQMVVSLLCLWGIVSYTFQRFLERPGWEGSARFGWLGADIVLLTMLLSVIEGPLGPLSVCYAAVVMGSGLWFRVSVVAFATPACLLAYAALMVIRTPEQVPLHYMVLHGLLLILIGGVTAYQVQRIGTLSRYFERQRPR